MRDNNFLLGIFAIMALYYLFTRNIAEGVTNLGVTQIKQKNEEASLDSIKKKITTITEKIQRQTDVDNRNWDHKANHAALFSTQDPWNKQKREKNDECLQGCKMSTSIYGNCKVKELDGKYIYECPQHCSGSPCPNINLGNKYCSNDIDCNNCNPKSFFFSDGTKAKDDETPPSKRPQLTAEETVQYHEEHLKCTAPNGLLNSSGVQHRDRPHHELVRDGLGLPRRLPTKSPPPQQQRITPSDLKKMFGSTSTIEEEDDAFDALTYNELEQWQAATKSLEGMVGGGVTAPRQLDIDMSKLHKHPLVSKIGMDINVDKDLVGCGQKGYQTKNNNLDEYTPTKSHHTQPRITCSGFQNPAMFGNN